jgi:hypothetical protein
MRFLYLVLRYIELWGGAVLFAHEISYNATVNWDRKEPGNQKTVINHYHTGISAIPVHGKSTNTSIPICNQWNINVFMMLLLKERYTLLTPY